MSPANESFPTRRYAYYPGQADAVAAGAAALTASSLYRFVMGRDAAPVKVASATASAELRDPFGRLVLSQGHAPQTANELLGVLAQSGELARLRSFLVADGGQIPWTAGTASVVRAFRFLLTLGRADQQPVVYVSTTPPFDSPDVFLQVVGWDEDHGAYQFYDRRQGAWVWAGSSWDALAPDSRGHGPFDSHVNGALNMKELKNPWVHWHSVAAGIRDEALAPSDTLRAETLWKQREGADILETEVIRPGIWRWTEARFKACTRNGRLERLPEFLRQVLTTSTVNLSACPVESALLSAGTRMPLPLAFFMNSDALVEELGLDPGIDELLALDGASYLECLRRYKVRISDGIHEFPGDTHFAFVVPEPALEDLLVLRKLIELGILPRKLAASLLMVDFTNPVFSRRREALLRYAPETARIGPDSDFAGGFLAAVETAAATLPDDSPEHELLAHANLSAASWQETFEQRLAAFFTAVRPRLASGDGFAPLFELAESRRREFRKRPLAEFRLTVPITNIPDAAPLLELRPDGSVVPKS